MNPCPHWPLNIKSERCGGCVDRTLDFRDLARIKSTQILNQFELNFQYLPQNIDLILPETSQVRERIDFTIHNGAIGLTNAFDSKTIVDITSCDVIDRQLFSEFDKIKLLLKNLTSKGSFRMRLDNNKYPYLWMDVSHIDTQKLLSERSQLDDLLQYNMIEWGQRRKPLIRVENDKFRLRKKYENLPLLFSTLVLDQVFPLKMHVADFSQPNQKLNHKIAKKIVTFLNRQASQALAEFGSGIGNFTFAMAPFTHQIFCYEWDNYSCESWKQNLFSFRQKYPDISTVIELNQLNASKQFKSRTELPDTLFVNPSRSGLGKFFESISTKKVRNIIYLSCYPESLLKDMKSLQDLFFCQDLVFIDQFPYSQHIEVLGLWTRKN